MNILAVPTYLKGNQSPEGEVLTGGEVGALLASSAPLVLPKIAQVH